MAPSLIEKYQQILAADPRSRIFVELARALLERGDATRAMEVCRAGLEHHPKSILGRVTWGRALLAAGDPRGAQDQFDVAIGIDPGTPYAYNLVGDVLAAAGLFKEALPVLTRAAELQPADAQARARLEEARRRAGGGTTPAMAAVAPPAGMVSGEILPPRPPLGLVAQAADAQTEELTLPLALDDLPAEAEAGPPPPPVPPPGKGGLPGPRTLLGILPPSQPEPAAAPATTPSPAEATHAASVYERELRARAAHAEAQAAAPSRRGRLIALVALAVVLAGAGGTFAWFRARARAEELERTLKEARVGLARDTRGALAKAAEVLARVRAGTPHDPRLLSLVAQVNAVLGADHGEAAARALALELVDPAVAGDGALAARWLLAHDAGEKAEATRLLLAPPAGATLEPILDRLAGEALLARGEPDAGRARLAKAAAATPPHLAALAALGDSYLKAGDGERALAWYEGAIRAHATHPRSVIGAAEARLALGLPLDGSLKELAALEADPASPAPVGERLRLQLAAARVEAATGDVPGAVRRLALAAGALGDSSRLESTRAGLLLAARRWEEAEAAAAAAVRLEPKQVDHRVLLARARNGAHRHAAALQALEGQDGRAAWLERGIALHGLGRQPQARAALERTLREGKMPGDAAVWYARADLALGHAERAVTLLTRLAAAPAAGALVQATLGEALLAARRPVEAESACAAAIARDARAPEGHRCLGQVLVARGRAAAAVAPLEQAVALDPADPEAKRLLAAARAPPPAARTAPPGRVAPPPKTKR